MAETVMLTKGKRVNLTKGTGLKVARLGLGWDTNQYKPAVGGVEFDLDLTCFICGKDGKCLGAPWMIFYNSSQDPNGAVVHSGDNQSGEGEGDDESVVIDFAKLPPEAERIIIAVTICNEYDESEECKKERAKQNFGMVRNSYIRIVNEETREEMFRYDLCEDFDTQTAVEFGAVYKHNGQWKFEAIGSGYEKRLGDFCKVYGIEVGG